MFWWLWNYLKGYVIIRVSGFSVERFINLCALNGFSLWDIKSCGRQRIMKASYKDIKGMFETSQRCGCDVEIIKLCGMPCIIKKAGKKKVFSAGIALFAAAIFTLTRFVWVVEVEGSKNTNPEEILDFCRQEGVYPGSLIKNADFKKLGQDIILEFDTVNWAAVNIKGTKVTVSVAEKLPETKIIESGEYASDIVAKKDGIIESIMTEKGTALVKAGDVVEKGDILIKGEVILKDGETEVGRKYENAQGSIKAKTNVYFETNVEKEVSEKIPTGEKKRFYTIAIDGMEIRLFAPEDEESYSEKNTAHISPEIGDFKIPFSIEVNDALFYEEKKKTLSYDEALEKAKTLIEEKKEELISSESIIADEKDDVFETNEAVKINTYISLIEEIGEEKQNNNIRGDFVTDGTKGDIDSR